MTVMAQVDYPLSFRSTEPGQLFKSILDGDSATLIGVGSVGKTHLIAHFAKRSEVQNYLFGDALHASLRDSNVLFIPVDGNAMLDMTLAINGNAARVPATWSGFELLLRSLRDACQMQSWFLGDLRNNIDDLYGQIYEE